MRTTVDPTARAEDWGTASAEVYGDRLEFTLHGAEVFDSWCQLQTATGCGYGPVQKTMTEAGERAWHEQTAEFRACVLSDIWGCFDTLREVDCTHATLCERCLCDAAGCVAYTTAPGRVTLQLRPMSDESLLGVFDDLSVLDEAGYLTALGTVRFRRLAP